MPVSRKRVQRLMRAMGLRSIYRRPSTGRWSLVHPIYPYLLRNVRITRPHQALGYQTPAEVFHGEQDVVEGDSNARRGSPGRENHSLAGAPGFSLNSPLIMSK